jgi:thiol-disulfide isomerase/thioredoxin
MKKYFLLFLLSINTSFIFSQTAELTLTKTAGHILSFYVSVGVSDEKSNPLKVPDHIKLKQFNYYCTYIAPLEDVFRKYHDGEITYHVFAAKLKAYNRYAVVDTNQFLSAIKSNGTSKINMISGIDSLGNKIICVDANQDNRITSEEIFKFSPLLIDQLKENSKNRELLQNIVLKQVLKNGFIRTGNVKINPTTPIERTSDIENRTATDFSLLRNEYWSGEIKIKNEQIKLCAQSKTFFNELNMLQFQVADQYKSDEKLFEEGDVWSNKVFSLVIDSVRKLKDENIKLYMHYQSPPIKHSDTTFYMSIPNINNNNLETLKPLLNQNKYILIDYWGTWCKPCIAKIPDLIALNQRFSSKLTMVSIAYDENIDVVKKFHDVNPTPWSNYFIDRNNYKSLIRPLKISVYPTFRLYSQQGKLIYEGNKNPDADLIYITNYIANY